MSKIPINGSHVDIEEINMIGPLKMSASGNWVFGVQWKRTGAVGNIDATPEPDPDKRFSIEETDQEASKKLAEANYSSFLEAWYGKEGEGRLIPISSMADSPKGP